MSWGFLHAGALLVVAQELPVPQAILALGSHEWERLPAVARLAARYPDALRSPLRRAPTILASSRVTGGSFFLATSRTIAARRPSG